MEEWAWNSIPKLYDCVHSGFKWHHYCKMEVFISMVFWLHFCTAGGSGDQHFFLEKHHTKVKTMSHKNTHLVWEHNRSWFLRGKTYELVFAHWFVHLIFRKDFGFFTQEVEFCRKRKCIAIRDKGIIPCIRRLHIINRQFVGPGDMNPSVTMETTTTVTRI